MCLAATFVTLRLFDQWSPDIAWVLVFPLALHGFARASAPFALSVGYGCGTAALIFALNQLRMGADLNTATFTREVEFVGMSLAAQALTLGVVVAFVGAMRAARSLCAVPADHPIYTDFDGPVSA